MHAGLFAGMVPLLLCPLYLHYVLPHCRVQSLPFQQQLLVLVKHLEMLQQLLVPSAPVLKHPAYRLLLKHPA
jgi:hypothetical protein